jgi:hypothetical protein
METSIIVQETNDLITRFLDSFRVLNINTGNEDYIYNITRYGTDLAGVLNSLQYEKKENEIVNKLNQSINLIGSVFFLLNVFDAKSITDLDFNAIWRIRFEQILNTLLKLKEDYEKNSVQAFPGEWLLCD